MKVKYKFKGKEYDFEIQEMSPLDYYNIFYKAKLGQIDFKVFAGELLKECVVTPVEARKVEYFEQIPRVLDLLCGKIGKICDAGLEESLVEEIVEE